MDKDQQAHYYPSARSRGGDRSPPPLFLDQTEARRAEKYIFLQTGPPAFYKSLDDAPSPPPPSQGLDSAVYPVFEDPSNGSNTRHTGSEPDIKALYYHELAKTIAAALKKNRIFVCPD